MLQKKIGRDVVTHHNDIYKVIFYFYKTDLFHRQLEGSAGLSHDSVLYWAC